MSKKDLSVFSIAATYIGTVVGAGFASGQEVLQFFGYHGVKGFIGLLIAAIIFVVYGYIILLLGNMLNATSHYEVIMKAGVPVFGKIIDYVIIFFLFGAFTAMLAGTGAIFKEQFGLPTALGSVLMAVISVMTVLTGIAGVISAISFVVPILLIGVFVVSLLAIIYTPEIAAIGRISMPINAAVKNFFVSGIIYASYNLLMSVAILAPLGNQTSTKSKLKWGAIFGGIGLGFGATMILFAILTNMPQVSQYQIPMLYIAGRFSNTLKLVYSFILIAEIYTTAVGNLYGFAARLTVTKNLKYKIYTIIAGGVALVLSRFGFSKLVHYMYPLAGYAGIIMLFGLTYGLSKRNNTT
ncbi:hypothetical protein [Thermoanaerobacterium sp. RBIITD]|uniref:YkvI family membrane protein n=1 Tax=Thermoanaerobacterium sp. RBIITD TaxID=1550240 RepID=UPI000BB9AC1F|nr:hypothetical protein [Thermoanaerobacterium sp. RBIITD]SNX55049.1 Uncharacterized membrane protein YkvI [Thermoanaerobacterium sp. RBIITD]